MRRRIIATKEAATRLENQLDHLIDHHAPAAAHQLKQRFDITLANHVAVFPRTGRYLAERDLWETWIPRTRLVIWYRFSDDELILLSVWHTSQDRDSAD